MIRLFLLSVILAGCVTDAPVYQPESNDEYIEQLIAQTDQQIKAETSRTYAYAGIALLVAGVATLAFTGKYVSGLIISIAGGIIMTFPFVLNSEYFDWIAGGFLLFVAVDGLIFLYKFQVNKNKSDTKSV